MTVNWSVSKFVYVIYWFRSCIVPRTVSIDYIAASKDDRAIHQCSCTSAAIAARAPHLDIIMQHHIHYVNE